MKTSSVIWLIIVIVLVVGGIWWWMASAQPGTNQNITVNQTSTPAGDQSGTGATGTSVLALNTASTSALGTFLVASNGMTLYHFTRDTANKSNCTGQCLVTWPPYTVTSSSSIPGGLDVTGKIGTITRTDGSLQLTYNSEPLYFYAPDTQPGDTKGQNVGGVWFVVKP